MTTDIYDPRPEAAYAHCTDCSTWLQRPEDSQGHPSSHRVRVMNPTRSQRIARVVDQMIQAAVRDHLAEVDLSTGVFEMPWRSVFQVVDELEVLLSQDHVTAHEIDAALKDHDPVHEAWIQAQEEKRCVLHSASPSAAALRI